MRGFHSTFYSFGSAGFNPENWKDHFTDYNEDEWVEEGSGIIHFFSDEDIRYSLMILHSCIYGLLLSYDVRDLETKQNVSSHYSVGRRDLLNEIEDVGDDEFFPVGCFLSPEIAWYAVEDFLRMPIERSNRIEWIESEEIPWPDW